MAVSPVDVPEHISRVDDRIINSKRRPHIHYTNLFLDLFFQSVELLRPEGSLLARLPNSQLVHAAPADVPEYCFYRLFAHPGNQCHQWST